jgi:hypothetical protein
MDISSAGEVLADNQVLVIAKQSNLWDSAKSCSAMIWSELERDRILRVQNDNLLRIEFTGILDRNIIIDGYNNNTKVELQYSSKQQQETSNIQETKYNIDVYKTNYSIHNSIMIKQESI